MKIKKELSKIYKAAQCSNINDYIIAIQQIKDLAMRSGSYTYTIQLQTRLSSLSKKLFSLLEPAAYTKFIGCKCKKISLKKSKPFKSGNKINTIKGVIIHPILNIPAFTFLEDESYVECRRIVIEN